MGGHLQKKNPSIQIPGLDEPGQQPRELHRGERVFLRPSFHVLLVMIVGLLVYSNTLHSPFQWDDTEFIAENPMVKDLSFFAEPSRAKGLLFFGAFKLRYVGYLTFALNYKLHGFDVFGYHVVNIAIHLVNAVLVYFFVLLTFRTPFFIKAGYGQSAQVYGEQPKSGGPPHDSRFTFHDPRFIALVVALFFVAHPLQTEAVTYVFQRLASLVSMFYLLSLVLYIKGRLQQVKAEVKVEQKSFTRDPRPSSSVLASTSTLIFFFFSLLSAVAAMKTKENAFTLPLVIVLYEFLFFRGTLKSRLLMLTPWLLTMLIIPVTMSGSGSTAAGIIGMIKDPASLGFERIARNEYLFTQFRVVVTYLRLLFLPVNQNIDYAYPLFRSFFTPPVFLSFLFLLTLFGTAVWLIFRSRQEAEDNPPSSPQRDRNTPFPPLTLRGGAEGGGVTQRGEVNKGGSPIASPLSPIACHRLIAFGILWFFITLSIESSIIPIPMLIDEYRAYLPSVGFFIALATAVALLLQKSSLSAARNLRFAKVTAVLCSVLILALGSAAYARNFLWKDRISLWEDVVRKSPSLSRGHNNLGIAYKESGSMEKAIAQYRIATQLNPDFPLPYMNMGNALDATGRPDEAIKEYEVALRLDPSNWQVRLNLGKAYGERGMPDKAIEQLDAALKLNPFSALAYNNLGNVYIEQRATSKAIDSYLEAVRLKPDYADAFFNLGVTYEENGKLTEAIEKYREALRIKPDYAEAHYNLGRIHMRTGHPDEGLDELRTAIGLSPNNVSYRNTLGILYAQRGLRDEAIAQFQEAVRLAPDNQSFRRNLERARAMKSTK